MTETGELTYRRVHRASPELLFDYGTGSLGDVVPSVRDARESPER